MEDPTRQFDPTRRLEDLLANAPRRERVKVLRVVYRQLVPGQRSGQCFEGEFQEFFRYSSDEILSFVSHLENKLREHRLSAYANRLREHYSLQYGRKPEV